MSGEKVAGVLLGIMNLPLSCVGMFPSTLPSPFKCFLIDVSDLLHYHGDNLKIHLKKPPDI